MIRLALVALVIAACDEPAVKRPPPARDAQQPTRVFEPPPGEVRPVPPFAIGAGGVGPYQLGASLADILYLLPRGPRIEILQIEGVAEYNLVRAEGDRILMGGRPRSPVGFIAVLDKAIARTADDLGVGDKVDELAPLGAVIPGPADPRLHRRASLPGVRFVLRRGVVEAMLVTGTEDLPPAAPSPCAAPADVDAVLQVAGAGARSASAVCAGEAAEAMAVALDDRVVVVSGEPGKRKPVAQRPAAGLQFLAPIDVDGDGRDEIALVMAVRRDKALAVAVELLRWDGARLVSLGVQPVYEVTAVGAAWTGADVREIELLVELAPASGGVRATGVYLRRADGGVRELAPLLPREVRFDRARPRGAPPAEEPPARPARDAGAGAP